MSVNLNAQFSSVKAYNSKSCATWARIHIDLFEVPDMSSRVHVVCIDDTLDRKRLNTITIEEGRREKICQLAHLVLNDCCEWG